MAGSGNFVRLPWAIQDDTRLDDAAKSVYAAILRYADFGSEMGAAVSDKRVAEKAGCSISTTQRKRVLLKELGWIDWENTAGSVNRYTAYQRPTGGRSERPNPRSQRPNPQSEGPEEVGQRDRQPRDSNQRQYQEEINEVFQVCRAERERRLGKRPGPNLQLNAKRKSAIRARPREGFSVEDLLDCARGFYADDWKDRDRYLDPYHAFKSDETVRRFFDQYREASRSAVPTDEYASGREILAAHEADE